MVTVVASFNVDFFFYLDAFPLPGESKHAHRFSQCFGGKGANVAVACASLSESPSEVRVVGFLGDDASSSSYLAYMEGLGLDTSGISTLPGEKCGMASISVDASGENQILIYSGANKHKGELSLSERAWESDLIVSNLEMDFGVVRSVFQEARERKASILRLLNPSPLSSQSSEELVALLGLVDVCVVNKDELRAIVRMLEPDTEEEKEGSEEEVRRASEGVLGFFPEMRAVVITFSQGCQVVQRDSASVRLVVELDQDKVVDTTGAGDCFLGALCHFLERGLGLEEACEKASQVATLSVQREGTQPSYPTREELPESLRL